MFEVMNGLVPTDYLMFHVHKTRISLWTLTRVSSFYQSVLNYEIKALFMCLVV